MDTSGLQLFRLGAKCITANGLLPSLYDHINCPDGGTPQITSVHDVVVFVGNIVRILIALSGTLAVIAILGSAIFYITAAGDPGRVTRAKEILKNTAIGLAVILISYAAVTYVAGRF